MEMRFLGHACFELSDGDTTSTDRPVPDRQSQGRRSRGGCRTRPRSCSPTATATTSATRSRSPSARARRSWRSSSSPNELGEEGVDVRDPNIGGTVKFDWGWVKLVPAWHTSTTPKGTANAPAGLLINFEDTIVYHLGDTCLFSDLQLVGKRHRSTSR